MTVELLRGHQGWAGAGAAAPRRLIELDGLRGIAALAVVLGHISSMLPETALMVVIQNSPLRIFWGANAAVYLFFVLSGFVLAFPFLNGDARLHYFKFMVLRVFRIYPAYLAALMITLAAIAFYDPTGMTGLSAWGRSFWNEGFEPITAEQMIRSVMLVPGFDTRLIDPPMWSLIIEMRMCFLVPLAVFAFRRSHSGPGDAIVFTVAAAAGFMIEALYFFPMFVAGMVLAKHWERALMAVRELPLGGAWGLLVTATMLYGNEYLLKLGQSESTGQWLTAVGTLPLLVLAVAVPWLGTALRTRPVQFLGKVSYSLYLIHFPILILSFSHVKPVAGVWSAVAVAIFASLAASWASYLAIELPMMRLGKRFASPFAKYESQLSGYIRTLGLSSRRRRSL